MAEPTPHSARPVRISRSAAWPVWVHAATLVGGLVLLLVLARDQWFYLDEWDILWGPQAARRALEGHNGHWSVVPIAVWRLLQSVFGLSSYLPYVTVSILAHLVVAHLLWRVMRRVGVAPWIGVALSTVFVLLGAAGENLFWGFQMGFMGAIAFGLGALLLAMRPTITPWRVAACALLLLLGVATAGTVLPLFIPVTLTLLVRHGWRMTAVAVLPPGVAYLIWYIFFETGNPTATLRASGIQSLFTDVPVFIATMIVGGLDKVTPVPGFGIVLTTALVIGAVVAIGRRALRPDTITVLGLLAAAVFFAALTAYSRVGAGIGSATDSRYLYVIVVMTLPAIGLLLTRLVGHSLAREIVVLTLIAAVGIYNVGLLIGAAAAGADSEQRTHRIISAALDLADEYPDDVDGAGRPAPPTAQRSLAELQQLESEFGLTRVPYTESDRLEALADISLSATPTTAPGSCDQPLAVGESFPLDAEGRVLQAEDQGEVTLWLRSDGTEALRTLPLAEGATEVAIAAPVTAVVDEVSGSVSLCR